MCGVSIQFVIEESDTEGQALCVYVCTCVCVCLPAKREKSMRCTTVHESRVYDMYLRRLHRPARFVHAVAVFIKFQALRGLCWIVRFIVVRYGVSIVEIANVPIGVVCVRVLYVSSFASSQIVECCGTAVPALVRQTRKLSSKIIQVRHVYYGYCGPWTRVTVHCTRLSVIKAEQVIACFKRVNFDTISIKLWKKKIK